jgi:hypothetical protein
MRDLLCKEVYPHFFAKVMRDLLQADGNSIASYTVYCTVYALLKTWGKFFSLIAFVEGIRCCKGYAV